MLFGYLGVGVRQFALAGPDLLVLIKCLKLGGLRGR